MMKTTKKSLHESECNTQKIIKILHKQFFKLNRYVSRESFFTGGGGCIKTQIKKFHFPRELAWMWLAHILFFSLNQQERSDY